MIPPHIIGKIPAFSIKKELGKNFIFHSNLGINLVKTKEFPRYYSDIFLNWEKHFSSLPFLPSYACFPMFMA